MKVKQIHIKYRHSATIRIYAIGDIHGGTIHCHQKLLEKTIHKVKSDDNAYWIDFGDKCEFIGTHDKRWDAGGIADWVKSDYIGLSQADWYMDIMSPIKDRCLGMIEGNHESAWTAQTDTNVHHYVCSKMGIDDLTAACFLRINFSRGSSTERHELTGYFTHGAGSAITPGAKLTRLQRLMDSWDADMVAQGHVHELLTYSRPYMTLSRKLELKQRVKVGALTGCYFRTYTQDTSSSYGERKNYPPVMLGSPVFVYSPETQELRVENG